MPDKKPQPVWRKSPQKEGDQHRSDRRPRGGQQKQDGRKFSSSEHKAPELRPIEVTVRKDDFEHALRVLKMKVAKEGILADVKRKKSAEKPSEKKRRRHREALKRMRKSKGRKYSGWKHDGDRRSKVAASIPVDRMAAVKETEAGEGDE